MLVMGGAFFFILLDRLNLQVRLLNTIIVIAALTLTAAPLLLTLTNPVNFRFQAPWIKFLGQEAQPDEWITTDMPWATAWYADRASLWLPDSITDFESLHDNVCPTGLLILSPVSWSGPYSNFTTGEYKDWFPFLVGLQVPATFPLTVGTRIPLSTPSEYLGVWSDRPRWQTK
jgi:hypothetical protein